MNEKDLAAKIQTKSGEFNIQKFYQLLDDTSYDVATKIMARFVETVVESEHVIILGKEQNLIESIWKAFHKLAGTSELLGFDEFSSDCRLLSKNLQSTTELQDYEIEISDLLERMSHIKKIIKDVLDETF